jgi:hypothetical protein
MAGASDALSETPENQKNATKKSTKYRSRGGQHGSEKEATKG